MWILFYSVVLAGLIVALERTVYLHKGKIRSSDFVAGIVNLLKKGRTLEALSRFCPSMVTSGMIRCLE